MTACSTSARCVRDVEPVCHTLVSASTIRCGFGRGIGDGPAWIRL